MNLGNKIGYLRKKKNLSQEELAEMIGVTRQTISKWELGDTTPDINQAKMLAKIFDVSLDELTNNDINNILVQKISNTERLAGITIGSNGNIFSSYLCYCYNCDCFVYYF